MTIEGEKNDHFCFLFHARNARNKVCAFNFFEVLTKFFILTVFGGTTLYLWNNYLKQKNRFKWCKIRIKPAYCKDVNCILLWFWLSVDWLELRSMLQTDLSHLTDFLLGTESSVFHPISITLRNNRLLVNGWATFLFFGFIDVRFGYFLDSYI